jgi:hypothetical protein
MTQPTHLLDLNLMFHCFEPDPISIQIAPSESAEMMADEMRYEAEQEQATYRDERERDYED